MQPLLRNPKIAIVFRRVVVDEADTSIKPNRLHVIWLAGGPYLKPLLQQSLYQQHIRPVVQKDVVEQPPAAMNGHFFRLLIFHIDIDEAKRSI